MSSEGKHIAGGHALGGTKPASASTLEGQEPYFLMQISRLVILLGGGAKPCRIIRLGGHCLVLKNLVVGNDL